jgi:pimeloyl-ACP methyl ester carboxylesterase
MSEIRIKRGFADTPNGQIHYAEAGIGKPVLLLHQTPRSWDEYRDVLPILGEKYRALAMDTIGFGDSYRLEKEGSIETYASGVVDFLDAMSIDRTSLVGHHTGGVIAIEVAATHPKRVDKLVLSSTPYVDAKEREKRKMRPPIDAVTDKLDGSHLMELWQKRMPFYPKEQPELLRRFVTDALKVGDRLEDGHLAVGRYRMEEKVSLIQAPTQVITGSEDPFSFPMVKALSRGIKGCQTKVIQGGMVPMVDQMPENFANAVMAFLDPP